MKNWGITTVVWKISCVVDRTKLPNLVSVTVVVFIYFWKKIKAFRPLEGRRCDELNLNGSIQQIRLLQSKTFFHPKKRPKTFFANTLQLRWSKFSTARRRKNPLFLLTSNVQNLFGFEVSRASVKELIYQKKNGGHLASKRVISM